MNWLFLQNGLRDAAFNMALDEALLEAMPRLGQPVLRCYGWTEPAATFGYFQKYAEVERVTLLRPLIRRPTGGGVVPHDADWTYSLAFPITHEWYCLRAEESYRRAHEWVQAAFAQLGVKTELAPSAQRTQPGQCFIGHEKSDVLWRGKKIAGAAQRRNKAGLLIQGSVQPPPISVLRADWAKAMDAVGKDLFRSRGREFKPDHQLQLRTDELATGKYSQVGYNQKR